MARHALGREAQGAQKMTTPNLIEAARAARNALGNLIEMIEHLLARWNANRADIPAHYNPDLMGQKR